MESEIIVGVGAYHVARNPMVLSSIGLGSCVGITLFDQVRRVGGLAHAMLPLYEEGRDKGNPGKYADTGIYLMIDELGEMGGRKHALKAKLVGGAQMFSYLSSTTLDVGGRNIRSARETLKREKIPIIAEEVGGKVGRTIAFNLTSGEIAIRSGKGVIKTL